MLVNSHKIKKSPAIWLLLGLSFLLFLGSPDGRAEKAGFDATGGGVEPARLSVTREERERNPPFWRRKDLFRKLTEERAIVVSVKRKDLKQQDLVHFSMRGAGVVEAPREFSFRMAQDYARLKEISDHFKTVTYDPVRRRLFLVMSALGYEARMVMVLTPVPSDWRSELQWEVVWGAFAGMKGLIAYEDVAEGRTEISLQADYQAKELPLPRILMGFTMEVLTQKVAERMRSFIEESHRKSKSTLGTPADRQAQPVEAGTPVPAKGR